MIIGLIQTLLEKIDELRDKILFPFIRRFWPKKIVPNHLSILRIFLGVTLAILLFSGFKNKVWILSMFCFGLFLDLFDGSVARALNKKTKIGALLDPIGDKVLILPVAIYSLLRNYFWLLFFIIIPEIISGIDAFYYKRKKQDDVEANIFGKTKMVLHSIAFGTILLRWPQPLSQFTTVVLLFSVVFAFLSILVQWLSFKKEKALEKEHA